MGLPDLNLRIASGHFAWKNGRLTHLPGIYLRALLATFPAIKDESAKKRSLSGNFDPLGAELSDTALSRR